MQVLAIGDIHGHLRALDILLHAVAPGSGDQLVFLGDYVDKGPDVKGVLDRLIALNEKHKCVFLRGNHDELMLAAHMDAAQFAPWWRLAGESPLAGYVPGTLREVFDKIAAEHWHFRSHICGNYFETPEYIFVHGGIRPDLPPGRESRERLLWMTLSQAEAHHSGKRVICGHSAQSSGEIADLGHTICIDTGITHDGWLSCLDIGSLEYWQSAANGACRRGPLRSEMDKG